MQIGIVFLDTLVDIMVKKNTQGHKNLAANYFLFHKGFQGFICNSMCCRHFIHQHLATYDNFYMFDAYHSTLSSRVGENGIQQQTNTLQLLYEASNYTQHFASPWPSVQC